MPRVKSKTMIEKFSEDRVDKDVDGVDGQEPTRTGTDSSEAATVGISATRIVDWRVADLDPHPDNPRGLNTQSPKFLDLLESIRRNGVLEPLTVRQLTLIANDAHPERRQVLSGHRRLAAAKEAGLKTVPVRDLGALEEDEAYDILAMSNLHEDLTPLEEGRRAAWWLANQNVRAVAAKLGKTEHWVLTHAMIEWNLIPGWKEEAEHTEEPQYSDHVRRDYSHWTAAHWIQIARLPPAIQEHWLAKVQKDYRFDPHDASAKKVGEWLQTEKLLLAKAPFDLRVACNGCDKRTDAIDQLLWEDPDLKADEGQAVRCLDPKCWTRQCGKAIKQDFLVKKDQATVANDIVGDKARASIAPICLATPPEGWDPPKKKRYDEILRPLRKAFGSGLVTADRVTIVKADTKGATLGIVVAGDKGHKKGSEVWVKVAKKPESQDPRVPSAADVARAKKQKEKQDRWEKVIRAVYGELAKRAQPRDEIVMLLCLRTEQMFAVTEWKGMEPTALPVWKSLVAAATTDNPENKQIFWRTVIDGSWLEFIQYVKREALHVYGDYKRPELKDITDLLGIDLNQRYAQELAKDTKAPPEIPDSKPSKRSGKTTPNPGDMAGPIGDCVGDCGVCQLDACAKTGALIDHGPKAR